jgi:hypothetical protein
MTQPDDAPQQQPEYSGDVVIRPQPAVLSAQNPLEETEKD